jgi:transcriptional regulator with XRE-family HTH domain
MDATRRGKIDPMAVAVEPLAPKGARDLDSLLLELKERLVGEAVATDDPEALANLDRLLVRVEQVRELLRERVDEGLGEVESDGAALLDLLADWLPGTTQAELAALAGTSTRTLQRLARDGGPPPNRLRLVARLVAELRHAWTPAGVIDWFQRPRPELEDRPPIELLDDPAYEARLWTEVRAGAEELGF